MGMIEPRGGADGEGIERHTEPVATVPGPGPPDRVVSRRWPIWGMALAVGVTAGLIAWLAGEKAYGTFAPPQALLSNTDLGLSPLLARAQAAANTKNAILAFGLLGAILGMALGVAGGLTRRSLPAAAIAGTAGIVVGGAAALGVSWALAPLAERYSELLGESLLLAMLIHGGIWVSIGAAAGLAFGLGSGGWAMVPRAVLGGVVGAALGTAAFDLLGALSFPLDNTASPLSTTATSRLLARLAVTLPVALGAMSAVPVSRHSPRPEPVE